MVLAFYLKVYPIIFLLKELLQKNFLFIKKFIFWGLLFAFPLLIFHGRWFFYYFLNYLPKLNFSLDPYYSNQSINGVFSRIITVLNLYIPQSQFSLLILAVTIISLFLLYSLTLRFPQPQLISLIWLGVITLLAGKNSFWNFTSCIFIGIYLFKNYSLLSLNQKRLFLFSVLISNYFWRLTNWANKQILNSLLIKIIYLFITSVGFLYLIIQIFLLISLLKIKRKEKRS